MAIQYIEIDEDPNIKALRETILNVGSSIAGGIAMRRKQQNDLAMQAMKTAHQNYLTQVGISSREKIAGEGHRLQQESLDLQENRFQHEKDLLKDEVNAVEGFDFWMDSSLNFELNDQGKLVKKGNPAEIKNAIKKINLHSGTRTKYTQAKLAIGAQQRTIGARVLAVKSAYEANKVRTAPFLQSVLDKQGGIDYSQLSKLARSDAWYKEIIDAGLVPAVTTGQKWQDENFQTYLNASTDFLKSDGTSWLPGPHSSANILQRRAVTSYNRAVKNIETVAKFDKTRPEITDALSSLSEGVDPFDDGRKNLIAQLVFSNAKSSMQASGFIPANAKQVRHYVNQQIGVLSDKLEIKLKEDGKYDTKEENYSQLFQDEYKNELEKYGVTVLEKPKGKHTEVGMYYLSQVVQGDVADEQGVLPSQKLYAHIMSNNPGLVGQHVNEILDPKSKEAKTIGDNFRNNNIAVSNLHNQPKNAPVVEVKGEPKDGVVGIDSDQMLNNVYRNWQGINNLPNDFYAAAETINKDLPYQLQLNSNGLKKVQEWYQSIEDKNPESVGVLRNDSFYNLEGEGGINIAVRKLMATKEGRSKLAELYANNKSDDQLTAVEKFHAGYVNKMMLQDPYLNPVLKQARKMTGVSDVTAEDLKSRVENKDNPASQRERISFFHQALGGNKRAWELLAQIFISNHGMGQ